MGKLAITGATGMKSGSAFFISIITNQDRVKTLFPEGIKLLVRNPKKLDPHYISLYKYEVLVGNLDDKDYLNGAFEGVDTIVHIAGVTRTLNVVEAAIKSKVRRIICVHTTGIYSKYKEAGELYRQIDANLYTMCKEYGISLNVLRPTMIYGNITDNNVVQFIKMVDKLPFMPVVNQARYELQPVHYEDLATAYFQVLMNEDKTGGKDYILSGGAPIQLRTMLEVIAMNLHKNIHFVSCPYAIAYAGAVALYWLTFQKFDIREKVQRLCEPRVFSYAEAHNDFGYSPRTFQEGVIREVKEYLQRK